MEDWIGTEEGLKERLEGIGEEGKQAKNNHESLCLYFSEPNFEPESTTDLLWRILSNPHCTIAHVRLFEGKPGFLAASQVTKVLKRWVREISATCPKSIWLLLHHDDTFANSQGILDDLREMLTQPNNQVEELNLTALPHGLRLCSSLVRPVIDHPNNELKKLRFGEPCWFDDDEEETALSSALQSPNCTLKEFDIQFSCLSPSGALLFLRSLPEGLERLTLEELTEWRPKMTDDRRTTLLTHLLGAVERPNNRLRSLEWNMGKITLTQASILAKMLINEHCRLEEFICWSGLVEENVAVPLLAALRHPNNRLKALSGGFSGQETFTVLGESLQDENCKLEILILSEDLRNRTDKRAVQPIANALKLSKSSRLRKLALGRVPTDAFSFFADSLRSSNNKLRELRMHIDIDQYWDGLNDTDFYRAVRISNIVTFDDFNEQPFKEAFTMPFVQVVYSLLSVKQIPRLGQSSWLRLLPISAFIHKLAETLGWPLDDLCLDFDE